MRRVSVLIDAGANADARPEHLLQFAHMGAIFSREMIGVRNPEVALLSIGEEPEKGNRLVREAHRLLAEDDDTTLVVGSWVFAGTGWNNDGDTALALAAAARAREYAQQRAQLRAQAA